MVFRIIQKHIKRQIISLEGGFQIIADLNAYHAFVSTLRIPQLTVDFSNLKMLGHVFIVSDAKDLAQIVRDVARYGGSFKPEVRVTVFAVWRTSNHSFRISMNLFNDEATGKK